MGSRDATELFDPSAALAVLDRMVDREEAVVLHSVASAWEAAWIACLTNSATWTSVAQDEFADVVVELHGVLWTVDRRKFRSSSLGLGKRSSRFKISRTVRAGSLSAVHQASVASLDPAPR